MLLSLDACECCFFCMPANVAFSACLRMLLFLHACECCFLRMPANDFSGCLRILLSISACKCYFLWIFANVFSVDACECCFSVCCAYFFLRMLASVSVLVCLLCVFPSIVFSEPLLLLFFCRPVLFKNCFLWILQIFSVRVLNDAFSECLRVFSLCMLVK